jgi:hypothetical protein
MPEFLICSRRGFHKAVKIQGKKRNPPDEAGWVSETLLRYPHPGVRLQQHSTTGA